MVLQVLVRAPDGAVRAVQALPEESVASVSGRCFPDAAAATELGAVVSALPGHAATAAAAGPLLPSC